MIPDIGEKLTRIFIYRTSNLTGLMTVSLTWFKPAILKKEKIIDTDMGNYYQDAIWLEGELMLIVDDYYEKFDYRTEDLINMLNGFRLLVIGYPNEVLESKLIAGYQTVIIDHDIPNEYKESEKQTIGDLASSLYSEGRIINKSRWNGSKTLWKDLIAIALKIFKSDLVATKHSFFKIPVLSPLHRTQEQIWEAHINKIKSEKSNLNPDGNPYP